MKTKRIVTKIGHVYKTENDRLLQLVAIDSIQLNSDVIIVYKPGTLLKDKFSQNDIDFYHHTTVSAGIKQGLWDKIGQADTPDPSNLIFKQYFDEDSAEILANKFSKVFKKPKPFWAVWRLGDKDWQKVSQKRGHNIQAEDSSIVPPAGIISRLK